MRKKLNDRITFRIDSEEKEQVRKDAIKKGLDLGTYCRVKVILSEFPLLERNNKSITKV